LGHNYLFTNIYPSDRVLSDVKLVSVLQYTGTGYVLTLCLSTRGNPGVQLGLQKPMSYLQLVKGRYRVRMVVPAALQPVIGKASLVKALGTSDRAHADHLAVPYVAEFNERLKAAAAQMGVRHRLKSQSARRILANARIVIANVNMPRYWVTPPDVYARLDNEFHFNFDPCPCPRPEGFNSLQIDWGEVSYVNPPFRREDGVGGKGATAFFRKAIEQHRKGKTVVLVAPTQPYVNVMLEAGAELRSLGRVRWLGR
jgi:hypothetical protein